MLSLPERCDFNDDKSYALALVGYLVLPEGGNLGGGGVRRVGCNACVGVDSLHVLPTGLAVDVGTRVDGPRVDSSVVGGSGFVGIGETVLSCGGAVGIGGSVGDCGHSGRLVCAVDKGTSASQLCEGCGSRDASIVGLKFADVNLVQDSGKVFGVETKLEKCDLLPYRGTNWNRNQEWKEKRKRAKKNRRNGIDSKNWRVADSSTTCVNLPIQSELSVDQGDSSAKSAVCDGANRNDCGLSFSGGGASRGFFSECSSDVRNKLRESRARLLIAQNERLAAEEEAKLGQIMSPEHLIQQIIRITAMTKKLKNQTKDEKIGKWAEQVSDVLTVSIAESAPDSMPSLKDVGFGKSALESSKSSEASVEQIAREQRVKEYQAALLNVDIRYDNGGDYLARDKISDINEVKRAFADVAYTERELMQRELFADIEVALVRQGVGCGKIAEARIEMGIVGDGCDDYYDY